MIKENEVRINNYYNGGIELVGSLRAKLNANEHNDFQLTRGHFEALCGYTDWLKFINPIQLTEEWHIQVVKLKSILFITKTTFFLMVFKIVGITIRLKLLILNMSTNYKTYTLFSQVKN